MKVRSGVVLFVLGAVSLSQGCSSGSKRCVDDLGCPMGQRCVDGLCAPALDSGRPDAGPGDAGMTDAGTTGDGGDTTPPVVLVVQTQVDLRDGGVLLNTSFVISFDEEVAPPSVVLAASPAISLGPADCGLVRDCLFIPTMPLIQETNYTLSVTASDVYGNAMINPYIYSFRTQGTPDTTPPSIGSTVPADNATNVAPTTRLSITFTEPMYDVQVVTSPRIDLGTPSSADLLTFTYEMPASAWARGTTYVVYVAGFDLAQNMLPTTTNVTFTTAP